MQRLITLICLLFPVFLIAHNGSIQGVLYDSETNLPVQGALIQLSSVTDSITTYSDALGVYAFKGLEDGSYRIEIEVLGYEKVLMNGVKVAEDETTNLSTYLITTDFQLPEVTIPAIKGSQINTIGKMDIAMRPIRSSQDVLRIVPGLFIAQHAGGGKAEQIFLRGFDIDHGTDIEITVDGMPVNMVSHAHGQGYSDLHFVIPELIEQLDFQKGSYYADHGNFNTAGYVDFQTRNSLRKSQVKLEAGQYDTYRAMTMLNLLGEKARQTKNQHAYIASEYVFSNGYFDSPQNFRRLNLFGKYHSYFSERQMLTVTFSHFRSKWNASGQIPQRAVDDGSISYFGAIDDTEGGITGRTNANAQLTSLLEDGSIIKNQIYYSLYDFELYSNFTFFLNDSTNGDQIRQFEDRQIFGYRGSYEKESMLAGRPLRSKAGISLRYDQVKDNELSRTKNRKETLRRLALGDVDEVNLAAYIQETYDFHPKLQLQAGARFDLFQFEYVDALVDTFATQSQHQAIISPQIQLNYTPNHHIQFFVKAGTGFHSNDARVVLAQGGEEVLPRSYGVDVGTIWKPIDKLLLNLAVWGLDLEQEFVYVGDEGVVEPSGRTRRAGVDVSIRYQIMPWLFADADFNYTYARARDEAEGENYIPLAPLMSSIGGLRFQLKNGLNGSLRYRYLADRPANEDNSVLAEGYFLLDAVINYTRPKYELSLSAENLLNTQWKEAQFETESRLRGESESVSEIHFTPGSPFFLRGSVSYFF